MQEERKKLYEAIENERHSKLLVYVTGDKVGWETQIANDATDYLARQTTDMAPITVDTTVVPTALSNITRSDVVFVEKLMIDTHDVRQIVPVEKVVLKREHTDL